MMRQPVTIRASSIGALFDCPARWCAIHLEGRSTPSSGAAALGTAIHKGTAVFDTERLTGQMASAEAASEAAAASIERADEEIAWEDGERNKAITVAASLTGKYCREFAPAVEYAAVEIGVESLHLTDVDLILTGTTDRVRKTDSGLGIADLKSGKTAVGSDGCAKTQGHALQMGVYELVAEAALGVRMDAPAQIIGLQTNLTPDKQRIGTGEIEGAKEVLIGNADHDGLLTVASRIVHSDIPAWGNPKSMMCSPKYCPNFNTCFYRR